MKHKPDLADDDWGDPDRGQQMIVFFGALLVVAIVAGAIYCINLFGGHHVIG